MKNLLKISLLVLFIGSQAYASQEFSIADTVEKGKISYQTWQTWTSNTRLIYVTGYIHGNVEAIISCIASSQGIDTETKGLDMAVFRKKALTMYEDYSVDYVIAFIEKSFKDPLNRRLSVNELINLCLTNILLNKAK